MPAPLDPPKPGLDVQKRRGQEALLLIRVSPAADPPRGSRDLGVYGLQAVGRLQTHPQPAKEAQPVEGECLLKPLVQAPSRRFVDEGQLTPEFHKLRSGFRVGGPRVGPRKPLPPGPLLRLGQIAHDVLPLVPLATLDKSFVSKDRLNRLPKPLGPVDDEEKPPRGPQSPRKKPLEEGGAHLLVLRGRLDEPHGDLPPLKRDPQGNDHALGGKALAVQDDGHELLLVQPPLAKSPKRALARPDEAARDGRGGEAESLRDRLRALLIPP